MAGIGVLYADGRSRIIDLVSNADAGVAVPACPAWTVKDVLAHVVGIPADILAGRLDGVATEPWTQAQVDARRDKSVAEIIAEWRETGPQIDGIIDSFGPSGVQLLFDLTTHEHDIRLALDRPGARDAPAIDAVLGFALDGVDRNLRDHEAGPIEIRAGDTTRVVGDGEPVITLTTSKFELVRTFTGRRSKAQVAAMDWSADPASYLPILLAPIFSYAPADIVE